MQTIALTTNQQIFFLQFKIYMQIFYKIAHFHKNRFLLSFKFQDKQKIKKKLCIIKFLFFFSFKICYFPR